MKHIKEQFIRYMDAGFPIIYLNTYEEDKADALIRSVAGGRKIEEWNVRGYFENQVLMQAEAPLKIFCGHLSMTLCPCSGLSWSSKTSPFSRIR